MAERDERTATAPDDAPSGDSVVSDSPSGDSAASDSPARDSVGSDAPAPDGPVAPGTRASVPEGGAPRTPLAGDPGPGDFSGLLATLGHYLDRHAPDEVMVLLRAELERREIQAYASGWRDAAARYEPALEEARAATNGRALRLVKRTPGRAAVIPLRQDAPGVQGPQDGPRSAPRAPGDRDADRDAGDRAAPDGGAPGVEPSDGRPSGAALVPKSRTSRVPTIPRLRTTLRRPSGGGRTVTPDGGAL